MLLTVGLSVAGVGFAGTLADDGSPAASDDGPPPAGDPLPATTATTSEPTTAPTEAPEQPDPEAFVARLARAFAADDATTLFSLLHPEVVERYGEEQCRAHLTRLAASDIGLELVAVERVGPVAYETDGLTTEFAEGVVVRTRVTTGTDSQEQQSRLVAVDGELRWFTDCGTPRQA